LFAAAALVLVPNLAFAQGKSGIDRFYIMTRLADIMAKEKAQLWINHDKVQGDELELGHAPAFYE
jgi:hypothetical protein